MKKYYISFNDSKVDPTYMEISPDMLVIVVDDDIKSHDNDNPCATDNINIVSKVRLVDVLDVKDIEVQSRWA
jgi:hypothetical protein